MSIPVWSQSGHFLVASEFIPGFSTNVLSGLIDADDCDKRAFHDDMDRAVIAALGQHGIERALGMGVLHVGVGVGSWYNSANRFEHNPCKYTLLHGTDGMKPPLNDFVRRTSPGLLETAISILGLITYQEAMCYHQAFFNEDAATQNGVQLIMGSPLRKSETITIAQLTAELLTELDLGAGDIAMVPIEEGLRFLNINQSQLTNRKFRELCATVVRKSFRSGMRKNIRLVPFQAILGYIPARWNGFVGGDAYGQNIKDTAAWEVVDFVNRDVIPRIMHVYRTWSLRGFGAAPPQMHIGSRSRSCA